MEVQFEKEILNYLEPAVWENQNQELTQEVRLTEDLPDAGRVLGCWAQCILRSKEWRSGGMNAGGGVMVWTLYAPEDGGEVRCVEAWLPFQMKWSFPPTEREGLMCISCSVRSADARVISARKLMLRVCVGALGIAVSGAEAQIPQPGEVPMDVQLLQHTYPVTLPVEAGEKTVQLDEELELSSMAQGDRKILRCMVQPEIREHRIIGDRLVFRGNAKLQLLTVVNGAVRPETMDVPFSAFTDLDHEYDGEASAQIELAMTGLETEMTEDGHLRLKAGIAAQYMIWERKPLTIVEDAYSPRRDIRVQEQILMLPALLDRRMENCTAAAALHQAGGQTLDGICFAENPTQQMLDGEVHLTVPAFAVVLYQDPGGTAQGINQRMEAHVEVKADDGSRCLSCVREIGGVQILGTGENLECRCEIGLELRFLSGQGMTMVTGMELGELRPEDPDRPALILRRSAGERVWDIAKASGSTVDSIRAANDLDGEPAPGRMLLIPVQ